MEKLLISACLLGEKCRYDGGDNLKEDLLGLNEFFDLVPACPESLGGLPTPRTPSERKGASVLNQKGRDVTENFVNGAARVLSIVSFFNIKYAVLKENSPSCGVHKIHDGLFRGKLIDGEGVTTALLRKNGVKVYSETEALELLASLRERKQKKEETAPAVEEKPEPRPLKKPRPASTERKPHRKPEQASDRPSRKPSRAGGKTQRKPGEKPSRGRYRSGPRKWVQPKRDKTKK